MAERHRSGQADLSPLPIAEFRREVRALQVGGAAIAAAKKVGLIESETACQLGRLEGPCDGFRSDRRYAKPILLRGEDCTRDRGKRRKQLEDATSLGFTAAMELLA